MMFRTAGLHRVDCGVRGEGCFRVTVPVGTVIDCSADCSVAERHINSRSHYLCGNLT
jgi:hypothetical protein